MLQYTDTRVESVGCHKYTETSVGESFFTHSVLKLLYCSVLLQSLLFPFLLLSLSSETVVAASVSCAL